jgi:uncharacterized membrane protein SirB2
MSVPLLDRWDNFYVIVGSSAGALTGLQFVVITLISEQQATQDTLAIRAFGSPTVVHFCMVLLLAAIITAPWSTIVGPAIALGVCGACGLVYSCFVIRHARRQTSYQPEGEDWLWYVIVPLVAYAMLLLSSVVFLSRTDRALFIAGATSLLLLFLGIRNAWDTVTYIAIDRAARARSAESQSKDQQGAAEQTRNSV